MVLFGQPYIYTHGFSAENTTPEEGIGPSLFAVRRQLLYDEFTAEKGFQCEEDGTDARVYCLDRNHVFGPRQGVCETSRISKKKAFFISLTMTHNYIIIIIIKSNGF